jgi:uncharacterized protein (TIGR03067 family)
MQRLLPVLVVMSLSLVSVSWLGAGDKDKPKQAKDLEGTWTAAKGEAKMSLTFAGDKFTLTKSRGDKSEDITGTFKVDASKTPRALDMTITGGASKESERFKGKTALAIYKVDGDKLEWCANEPGKETRPKEFTSNDGGNMNHLYITFDRAKK